MDFSAVIGGGTSGKMLHGLPPAKDVQKYIFFFTLRLFIQKSQIKKRDWHRQSLFLSKIDYG